jgi:large subunit ribosomal protein L15
MRVARGRASGKGKTAGRGHKGQMSRKGHKRKLGFEGGQMRLVRRLPKRGFTNPTSEYLAPVNVASLGKFKDGDEVTLATLRLNRIVKGPADGVKILGDGELKKKLVVKANAFSATARQKIEAAGGSCEIVKN